MMGSSTSELNPENWRLLPEKTDIGLMVRDWNFSLQPTCSIAHAYIYIYIMQKLTNRRDVQRRKATF
jgi:hypothetical protein